MLRLSLSAAVRRLTDWLRVDEAVTDELGWGRNLAVFRVVFVATVVLPLTGSALLWSFRTAPGLPREAWTPISFYAWLPLDVLANAHLLQALAALNIVFVLLGLLGLFTRVALGVAALLSMYVLGVQHNLVHVGHNHHAIWILALLAAGPSGCCLSLDALLAAARLRKQGRPTDPIRATGALTTLRCVWVLLGLIYFMPGIGKLVHTLAGNWSAGEQLMRIIWTQRFLRTMYQPGYSPGLWVDALPAWMLRAGALVTILGEIGCVFLVLFRRARPCVLVFGLLFHVLNGLLVGVWFKHLWGVYAALIDWTALGKRLGRFADPPQSRSPTSASTRPLWTLRLVACFLIAGQAVVSSVNSLIPSWRLPRWPFDSYPHFTRTQAELTVWEARAVLADGREVRIGPEAYGVLGPAERSRTMTDSILRESNPERRRKRSRDLVQFLWSHEPPEIRNGTATVVVYEARYAMAATPTIVAERLLYRFDVGDLP